MSKPRTQRFDKVAMLAWAGAGTISVSWGCLLLWLASKL